jgi:hypothetical protein
MGIVRHLNVPARHVTEGVQDASRTPLQLLSIATTRAWPWLAALALASTLGTAGWPRWWWYPGEPLKSPHALADTLEVLQVAALRMWWRPIAMRIEREPVIRIADRASSATWAALATAPCNCSPASMQATSTSSIHCRSVPTGKPSGVSGDS